MDVCKRVPVEVFGEYLFITDGICSYSYVYTNYMAIRSLPGSSNDPVYESIRVGRKKGFPLKRFDIWCILLDYCGKYCVRDGCMNEREK